jgi:Flp pilus assembly pilin Flp
MRDLRPWFTSSGDIRSASRVDHRATEQLGGAATPMTKGELSSVAKQPSVFESSAVQSSNVVHAGDEHGQTMAEYAVILTVITAAVVLAVATLATGVGTHITDIAHLFP